jgi:hypothetical protein
MPPRIPVCTRVLRPPAPSRRVHSTYRPRGWPAQKKHAKAPGVPSSNSNSSIPNATGEITPPPLPPTESNPAQNIIPPSEPESEQNAPSAGQQKPLMANLLAQTSDKDNSLLAPVHIPEDPNAILKSDHPARDLLAESGIVIQRQIEMLNIFLGFEQANRYVILDPHGNHVGYMAEHDGGIAKAMGRQWFRTHRAFTTHIFDRKSEEVLRVGQR